jgi:hypothetical protein
LTKQTTARMRKRSGKPSERIGDRGHFRGEESGLQSGIIGRDAEVVPGTGFAIEDFQLSTLSVR